MSKASDGGAPTRVPEKNTDPLDSVFDILDSEEELVWPLGPEPAASPLSELTLSQTITEPESAGPEPVGLGAELDLPDFLEEPDHRDDWPGDDQLAAPPPIDFDRMLQANPGDDSWPTEPGDPPEIEPLDDPLDSNVDFWDPDEDELRRLPAGRTRIGVEEWVHIRSISGDRFHALCNTGAAHSSLAVSHRWLATGLVEITVAGAARQLSTELSTEQGALDRSPPIIRLAVEIGPHRCHLALRLREPGEGPAVHLGLDALAGAFVVDPAERFVLDA